MSQPDCFVVRPGGGWRGVVPVGMALWVGDRPVLGDRVIFLDRAVRWTHGLVDGDGRCFFGGSEWALVPDGVEETWTERDGTVRIRYRAWVVDESRERVVGAYYWVEQDADEGVEED